MTNPQFKPEPAAHDVEIMIDGKTHKGRYHIEHENVVVSYQGASKMAPQAADNDSVARSVLAAIVEHKQRH